MKKKLFFLIFIFLNINIFSSEIDQNSTKKSSSQESQDSLEREIESFLNKYNEASLTSTLKEAEQFLKIKEADISDELIKKAEKTKTFLKQLKNALSSLKNKLNDKFKNDKEKLSFVKGKFHNYFNKLENFATSIESHFKIINEPYQARKNLNENLQKIDEICKKSDSLIDGYKILEQNEKIVDINLIKIIKNTPKTSLDKNPFKLYINSAYCLYLNIIKLKQNNDNLFPKSFTFENEVLSIEKINLFHVFLGDILKNCISGIHSDQILPNIFMDISSKDKDLVSSKNENNDNSPDSNKNDNHLFLYKVKKFKSTEGVEVAYIFYESGDNYFFKLSTFFTGIDSLEKSLTSLNHALHNILFKIELQTSDQSEHDLANYVGLDKDNNLYINITYNKKNNEIVTFYPIYKVDKVSEDTLNKDFFKNLINKNSLSGKIQKKSFDSINFEKETFDSLYVILPFLQIKEKIEEEESSDFKLIKQKDLSFKTSMSPTPILEGSMSPTPILETSISETSDNITPLNTRAKRKLRKEETSLTPLRSTNNTPSLPAGSSSPAALFSESFSSAIGNKVSKQVTSLSSKEDNENLQEIIQFFNEYLNNEKIQSKEASQKDDDQQPLMATQAKMGKRTDTQPPSSTPSRKLYDQNNDDDDQQSALSSSAAFAG